jgi:hypothetical protein
MNTFVKSAIAALFLVGSVHAAPFGENTAEQKATSEATEKLNEMAELINKQCGTSVTIKVDWKTYAPVYNSFSEDQRDGRSLDNIYSMAEAANSGDLRNFSHLCKDEPIFKANVAKKLKVITIAASPQKDINAKMPSHTLKLNAGTLSISHHLFRSNNSAYDQFKKLF